MSAEWLVMTAIRVCVFALVFWVGMQFGRAAEQKEKEGKR